jgi:hypothetical protein
MLGEPITPLFCIAASRSSESNQVRAFATLFLLAHPISRGTPRGRVVHAPLCDRRASHLRDALAADPVRATEVAALAEAVQVKPSTLRRAYSKLGVQTFKRAGQWWWQLANGDDDRQRDAARARSKRPQ